jgi:biotin operon repressor
MARKPNPQVQQLRADLKKAQAAANKKVSRLKAQGVQVAGTEFDPRKPLGHAQVLTARQLEAQLTRLREFTSRGTQFVADAKHRPIPRREWVEYKNAENIHNARVQREATAYGPIVLPSGETVAARQAKMKADHARMGNPSVQGPHQSITRQPFNVKNREALKKLTRDAKRKMKPEYDKAENKRQRAEVNQILDTIKNDQLRKDIDSLSNDQFNILWNYTNFPDALTTMYEMMQLVAQGRSQSYFEDVTSKKFEQAKKLLAEAKTWDITVEKAASLKSQKNRGRTGYGQDPTITRIQNREKKQRFKEEMMKRGYTPVGNDFFKL